MFVLEMLKYLAKLASFNISRQTSTLSNPILVFGLESNAKQITVIALSIVQRFRLCLDWWTQVYTFQHSKQVSLRNLHNSQS